MRTLLLLTLLCLVLAACAGPSFPAVPPSRTPAGIALPDLGPQPGICGRTPEVQVSIIREIAVEGPRMSCGSIDPPELYRLRRLPVQSDYLRRGDFLYLGEPPGDGGDGGAFHPAAGVFARDARAAGADPDGGPA